MSEKSKPEKPEPEKPKFEFPPECPKCTQGPMPGVSPTSLVGNWFKPTYQKALAAEFEQPPFVQDEKSGSADWLQLQCRNCGYTELAAHCADDKNGPGTAGGAQGGSSGGPPGGDGNQPAGYGPKNRVKSYIAHDLDKRN